MRVFVAIEISDSDTLDSIENVQNKLEVKAGAVSRQNMHFTLQFLGEISENMIDKIRNELKKIIFSEFDIQVSGIDAFPNSKNARVIWVGIKNPGAETLIQLAKKVENALMPLGFKQDKPFKPHLTIFRIKKKNEDLSKDLKRFREYDFGKMKISSIKLKQSRLTPSGPIYSDIEVFNAN